jgi:hypothetical protein
MGQIRNNSGLDKKVEEFKAKKNMQETGTEK